MKTQMETIEEIKENHLAKCLGVLLERAYLLGRLDVRHDLECDTTQLHFEIEKILDSIYGDNTKE